MAFATSIALILCGVGLIAAGGGGHGTALTLAGLFFVALNAWISWATTVTRLHDLDLSGFFALLTFVPLGSFVLLGLCGFKAGTPGTNRFGVPASFGYGHLDEAMAAFDEPKLSTVQEMKPRTEQQAWAGDRMTPQRAAPAPTKAYALVGAAVDGRQPGFGRRGLSAS
ncbi:DUF805 domain-containing protein [Jiella sp. MQZ13P-4]|uniref:DUF805 domain-containing protein n=2 Tax=Jiella sonneratiae TaxID=2816856 RepID=A0ABS3J2L3_9HYPH|nr:DUF805 domain-containing protein [Jiella sonneratiae]